MSFGDFLWTTLGAILTLSTFSFLYKDNPFYKIAEHLVVGVSAGYFVIILWYTGLIPKMVDPLSEGRWWYFFPGLLGILMWFRFSKKLSWISRYPIAFYIGIATGVAIPLEMQNRVNRQLVDTMMTPEFSVSTMKGISDVIIIVGVLSALFYFFFSKEHKGAFGGVAKIGIYTLMLGFGASFGYTVMARISLFIQRVQDLRNWYEAGTSGGGAQSTVLWVVVLAVILLILLEIIRALRRKTAEAA
jgi:uncharacterized membrane protein YdcZ (DUF606 family)